jgi:predicted nucleic acid-binding protein
LTDASYFDSSVLLAILLKEKRAAEASAIWEQCPRRVSSILLSAESWIGIRRHWLRLHIEPPTEWIAERAAYLARVLSEVEIKPVDADVMGVLENEAIFAESRTLDAVHLATAVLFRARSEGNFALVSFDEKMRQTACSLNLPVLPVAL